MIGGTEPPARPDWNRSGRLADVLQLVRGLEVRLARRPGLITGRREILEYPMVDRDPLPLVGPGRVTLLGDAAHPMYPIGANGGSQAVIDARVLACSPGRARPPRRRAWPPTRRPAVATVNAIVLAYRDMPGRPGAAEGGPARPGRLRAGSRTCCRRPSWRPARRLPRHQRCRTSPPSTPARRTSPKPAPRTRDGRPSRHPVSEPRTRKGRRAGRPAGA